MDPSIVHEIQSVPYWGWKVALDLFFGGAGGGHEDEEIEF